MLGRWSQTGGDQQGAEFVAVQPGRVRLIVQPRAASALHSALEAVLGRLA